MSRKDVCGRWCVTKMCERWCVFCMWQNLCVCVWKRGVWQKMVCDKGVWQRYTKMVCGQKCVWKMVWDKRCVWKDAMKRWCVMESVVCGNIWTDVKLLLSPFVIFLTLIQQGVVAGSQSLPPTKTLWFPWWYMAWSAMRTCTFPFLRPWHAAKPRTAPTIFFDFV